MMETTYELKLSSGKTIIWVGSSGEEAVKRYTDFINKKNTVVAWRPIRFGVFIYNHNIPIIE